MTGAPASLDLIRRLVGYDTTSARSNLDLIAFVRDHLAAHGVDSRLVHDETGGKANLLATIGPADRPGIVLSGHTDVVPATAGEGWTDDPFTATLRGERLFGRGAADMKGFIGVVLAFVPALAARDLRLPVHIALSHDEEVGCIGVRRLLPVMAALPVAPALCLIGEPTGMKVGVAHKGKTAWRVTLRGRECHSGLAPRGVNAIEHAADLVLFIRDLAGARQTGGPFREEFEVPHTTLQTGTINGGSALNIVPGACSFDFEVRNVPGDDPAALLAEIRAHALDRILPAMRRVAPEADIAFEALAAYPGLDTPPDSDAVGLVKRLAGANDHTTLAFGTEGGLFREILGTPAVVCGPGHIEDAHRPDEFVSLDQIRACEDFMGRLLDWLSAPA